MARETTLTPAQWVEVEALYRSTQRPLRDIASEYGTSEAAVRRRAKKFCWVRQPLEAKRALVEARIAGLSTQSSQDASQAVEQAEVDADATTLMASAKFYRKVILRADKLLDEGDSSGKTIVETVKLATEGYMKVRGLDKPQGLTDGDVWDAIRQRANEKMRQMEALSDA